MSDQNVSEFFTKTLSTNTSLLTNIWHQSKITQVRKELCDNYTKNRSTSFVNDFVSKTFSRSVDLSNEEIQRIHIQNSENSVAPRCSLSMPNNEIASRHNSAFGSNIHEHLRRAVSSKNKKMYDDPWTPDIYLTDEYLDKLKIPPGDKRQRLTKFYVQSKSLYCYLSYHIGNESLVKFRRKIIDKRFAPNIKHSVYNSFASGSKAEGLDCKGSDIDIMVIDSRIKVYDGDDMSNSLTSYRYNSMSPDLKPGYVLVEIKKTCGPSTLLSSSAYKANILRSNCFHMSIVSWQSHGPAFCSSFYGADLDAVPCIKSITWPKIANEWVLRKRKYGWPSHEMIKNIQSQGCHLVPVGSKTDTRTTDDNEWRLSFSFAERELIHSFSHTQLLVYGLLKIILKEVICAHNDISEYLCSYFLKTTVFWVIEENPLSVWNFNFFILSFHLSLKRLIQFIKEENFPNYFVRINNMFSRRFTKTGKNKLLMLLNEILESGLIWIFLSSTMSKFDTFLKYPLSMQLLNCAQNIKFKKEMSRLILEFVRHTKSTVSCMIQQKHSCLLPIVKAFMNTPIIRVRLLGYICHYLDTACNKMTRKQLYTCRKLYIHLLCIGCRTDLACGKTMLACWLYNQGNFDECLQVTSFALECARFRCLHVNDSTIVEFPNEAFMTMDSSYELISHLNHYYTETVSCFASSKLAVKEFSRFAFCFLDVLPIEYRDNNLSYLPIYPEVYCHYLRFLCYLRQENLPHSEEEFEKMTQVYFIGSRAEKLANDHVIMMMKMTGRIVKRNVQNGCERDIYTLNDLFYNGPDGSLLNDIDWSIYPRLFETIRDEGVDTSVFRRALSDTIRDQEIDTSTLRRAFSVFAPVLQMFVDEFS